MSHKMVLLTAKRGQTVLRLFLAIAALLVAAILVWQGITASGSPDPTVPRTSPGVAILDIGVLVFREGLECILVLSAITASMMGTHQRYRRPIAAGVAIGFLVTVMTWFIAVGIVSDLTRSIPALDVQAATGLFAVIVLLIVMNWFFHKVYWTGWISMHNRKKRDLLTSARTPKSPRRASSSDWASLGSLRSIVRESRWFSSFRATDYRWGERLSCKASSWDCCSRGLSRS